jgi:hypothetical protein
MMMKTCQRSEQGAARADSDGGGLICASNFCSRGVYNQGFAVVDSARKFSLFPEFAEVLHQPSEAVWTLRRACSIALNVC